MIIGNDYQLEASNNIARFKNHVMKLFWSRCNTQFSQDDYFKLNRSICDAIDDLIVIMSCDYCVLDDIYKNVIFDTDLFVKEHLAKMISNELIKSSFIGIKKIKHPFNGEVKYTCEIPFIKYISK